MEERTMYRYKQMLKGALLMGVALMLVVGCHHKKPKVYSPSQVQFSVEYNAFLESQFYPNSINQEGFAKPILISTH